MAESNTTRERVTNLRHRLLELHQSLVNAERLDYEKANGRVSAGGFLELLVNDPNFAWLRPMTALIVQLDELEEPGGQDAWDGTVTQLRALLSADPAGAPFQRRYAELLQESPDVGLLHAATIQALRG